MSSELLREQVRESKLGFHVVNTFQNCPRKWYIKYICGILPTKIGKALIQGKAWHEGMEVFYKGGTADEAYLKILSEVEADKLSFRKLEDYDEIMRKIPILFKAWFEALGTKLHDEFEVLEVEVQLEPKIAGKYTMTIRPDAIVKRRKDGQILVPEHKTTSYSAQAMIETVEQADQATAYTWGVVDCKPQYKLNFGGVLLDVVYNRSSVCDVQQIVIIRSKYSLAEFELSMLGLFDDLAKRIEAYDANPDLCAMIFPRNGGACSNFGCEYADICRTKVTPDMILGANYRVDPWVGRETLLSQYHGGADGQ